MVDRLLGRGREEAARRDETVLPASPKDAVWARVQLARKRRLRSANALGPCFFEYHAFEVGAALR